MGGCGWKGTDDLYKLIDTAKSTIDETARKAAYAKIQSIINEACPAIPIVSQNKIITSKADLKGISLTAFTDVDLSRAYRVK